MKKNILLFGAAILLASCTTPQEPGANHNPDSSPVTEHTEEILLSGDAFEAQFAKGTQYGSSGNQANNAEKMTTFIKGQDSASLINQITYEGSLNTLNDNEVDVDRYFVFGSQTGSGSLTFTTSKKIYKVDAYVSTYVNHYDSGKGYSGTNYDTEAKFLIDGTDKNLTVTTSGDKAVFYSCVSEYEEGTNTFKFENEGGRVMIQKFVLTYRD